MEQLLAERLALELKIDVTQVVREYWEVVLLNRLFESPWSRDLLFKGGTALRLAYGSPRFSEDLDFSLLKNNLGGTFKETTAGLVKPLAVADITDLAAKRWTYLCEIRITEEYLAQPFRIKLEISRRPAPGYRSELRLITSPTTPIQALCRVATLEQLLQDKQDCIMDRAAPKDIFDLWFISQKMGIQYKPPDTGITPIELKRDLAKYLPTDYQGVIEDLL
ncbi:MAG: nucleotidyl transferase AbiEii/AbiGii toxin family protein [Actinobacteria bacterium]|nr:nucleotidyl transferase AbiEii/AbiGii toxin family protein [Actinomycetota bacterium]MBU1943994.1 nucleotidyl transferase AbiEii/AbiGii toxin family protein [Actinomycetota bacterium]MBU2688490.1 nucleotidyl transferase AbiEii/AbiGii toxin family protein [Actinomycetota bacterium]